MTRTYIHSCRLAALACLAGITLSCSVACTASESIGHRLLRAERDAMELSPTEFEARAAQLDSLADQAIKRIAALHADDATAEGVKRIFNEIDSVLVDNDYVVFINTETLSDALAEGVPASGGRTVITQKMKDHEASTHLVPRYRFDCDTGGIIYLDILGRLNKPVVMFETPHHNCVRWILSPTEHVNWDVNDAASYTDDEHREGAPLTASGFSAALEHSGHYFQDMSLAEVEAYHLMILARLYESRGRLDRAFDCYERAIRGRPYSATPRNNLAWLITTRPSLQTPGLRDYALSLARSAVSIEPANGYFVDTLAATYASRGEFDKAIATETGPGGRRRADRIRAYEASLTPVDMNWKDLAPGE